MTTAQLALQAARHAYESPNCWGRNGQAFVDFDRAENRLTVAIAGTNGKRDAAQDVAFWKEPIGQGAEIHAGFLSHFKDLHPEIDARLSSFGAMDRPQILLTGHSLGAAIAVLLVWHRAYQFKGAEVVLFGGPFVGNRNFATMFEMLCRDNKVTVTRYVSKGDPVASFHAPGDWAHVGRLVEIGADGDWSLDHPLKSYAAALS